MKRAGGGLRQVRVMTSWLFNLIAAEVKAKAIRNVLSQRDVEGKY